MSDPSRRLPPRRSRLAGRHPATPDQPDPPTPPFPESPATAPLPETPGTPERPETPETEPFPAGGERRSAAPRKLTVNLPRELADAARDAFWLAHVHGDYRTFSAWVADALRRHIEHTKATHGVDEIPSRPGGSLPTGRPLG